MMAELIEEKLGAYEALVLLLNTDIARLEQQLEEANRLNEDFMHDNRNLERKLRVAEDEISDLEGECRSLSREVSGLNWQIHPDVGY